jgi:hypothetical protein
MILQDGYKWHMLNAKALFVFTFSCSVIKMFFFMFLNYFDILMINSF